MVARNRFCYPKPLGAEIARRRDAGLSRIPVEILTSNVKAGLYAYKLDMKRIRNTSDLQEMGKHFTKERMRKNAELRKVRRVKTQKVRAKKREETTVRTASNIFCIPCKSHVYGHRNAEKPAFIPSQLKMRTRCVRQERHSRNKSARTFAKTQHESFAGQMKAKCDEFQKTKMDEADISIMALRKKFNHSSKAYAADAIANREYDLAQQKLKLLMLNEMIHDSTNLAKELMKARAVMISNMAWKEKELIRSHPKRLHLSRNCIIKQAKMRSKRLPLRRYIKIAHKTKNCRSKGCDNDWRERALSSEEVLEAEHEVSSDQANLSGFFQSVVREAFNRGPQVTQDTTEVGINENESESDEEDDEAGLDSVVHANAPVHESIQNEGERDLTFDGQHEEESNVPPPPPYTSIESQIETPLATNSKSSLASSNDSNSHNKNPTLSETIDNLSAVKTESNELPNFRFPNLKLSVVKLSQSLKNDYVSLDPNETILRSDGLLPDLATHSEVLMYFEPFMNELVSKATDATGPLFSTHRFENLVDFLHIVARRIALRHPLHQKYCSNISEVVNEMYDLAMSERSELNFQSPATQNENWRLRLNNLSLSKSQSSSVPPLAPFSRNLRVTTPFVSSGSPNDGGDDSNSNSNSSSSSASKRPSSSKKSKRNNKKKHTSKNDSDSSSTDEDDGDKLYRSIVNALSKTAKYYKIKELQMHSDPTVRREKFKNWVIDLKNILSTNKKTTGIIDDYPVSLVPFESDVDRAVKTLLSIITAGMAKRIVNNSTTAYQALIDLRRNCGQTSNLDIHRERLKMMLLKQGFNEKASDFLRKVQKQMEICISVGCMEYTREGDNTNIVNIILQGLNESSRLYSATIAD